MNYTLGGIPRSEPPSCEAPRQPTIYTVSDWTSFLMPHKNPNISWFTNPLNLCVSVTSSLPGWQNVFWKLLWQHHSSTSRTSTSLESWQKNANSQKETFREFLNYVLTPAIQKLTLFYSMASNLKNKNFYKMSCPRNPKESAAGFHNFFAYNAVSTRCAMGSLSPYHLF